VVERVEATDMRSPVKNSEVQTETRSQSRSLSSANNPSEYARMREFKSGLKAPGAIYLKLSPLNLLVSDRSVKGALCLSLQSQIDDILSCARAAEIVKAVHWPRVKNWTPAATLKQIDKMNAPFKWWMRRFVQDWLHSEQQLWKGWH
jgi:hypothetical protein